MAYTIAAVRGAFFLREITEKALASSNTAVGVPSAGLERSMYVACDCGLRRRWLVAMITDTQLTPEETHSQRELLRSGLCLLGCGARRGRCRCRGADASCRSLVGAVPGSAG